MKKSFVFGMLLAGTMLVACGGGNSSSAAASSHPTGLSTAEATSQPTGLVTSEATTVVTSEEAEVVQVYEGLASYDELYDQFAAFEFYVQFYSDGTGRIFEATVQNSDNIPVVPTDDDNQYVFTSFKYKVEEDEGIETMTVAVNGSKVECYKNKDNQFKFDYSFTFAVSYSRTATILVDEEFLFEDTEDWVASVAEAYAGRTKEVKVMETYKGPVLYADGENAGQPFMINFGTYGTFAAEAKWELLSDFTVAAVYGVGGKNGGGEFAGTWTVDTEHGNLHIVTIGEAQMTGEKQAGGSEIFTWNFVHQAKDAEGSPVGDPVNLVATLSFVDPNA